MPVDSVLSAILLAMVAAIGFGFVPFFARLGLMYMRINTGVLISMIAGLVVIGLFAVPLHIDDMLGFSAVTFCWILILGFVNYRMGRFFNYTSVRLIGVSRATPLVATSPIWASLAALVFLHEVPSLARLIGVGVVVGGVGLIVSERS